MKAGSRGIRIRGAILIVLGIALAAGLAWVIGAIEPAMRPGGADGTTFTGTAEQGRLIIGGLIALLAVGIVFALYGIFMLATGRESRVMKVFAWSLWVVLVGAALVFAGPSRAIADLF